MKQRIQKIIANAGLASRRAAEAMITSGRVSVNGERAVIGQQADQDNDLITVDGKPLASEGELVYIMLNKPRGYVSTLSDESGRKTVAGLVADMGIRVYPVGRLDINSEGLLIMTNDGYVAHRLMHPSGNVKKTYKTTVLCIRPLDRAVNALEKEMVIDGRKVRPAEVEVVKSSGEKGVILITIGEGINRQVRKMCDKAGLEVLRLVRIREGRLSLGSLEPGKWRRLTSEEIGYLKRI